MSPQKPTGTHGHLRQVIDPDEFEYRPFVIEDPYEAFLTKAELESLEHILRAARRYDLDVAVSEPVIVGGRLRIQAQLYFNQERRNEFDEEPALNATQLLTIGDMIIEDGNGHLPDKEGHTEDEKRYEYDATIKHPNRLIRGTETFNFDNYLQVDLTFESESSEVLEGYRKIEDVLWPKITGPDLKPIENAHRLVTFGEPKEGSVMQPSEKNKRGPRKRRLTTSYKHKGVPFLPENTQLRTGTCHEGILQLKYAAGIVGSPQLTVYVNESPKQPSQITNISQLQAMREMHDTYLQTTGARLQLKDDLKVDPVALGRVARVPYNGLENVALLRDNQHMRSKASRPYKGPIHEPTRLRPKTDIPKSDVPLVYTQGDLIPMTEVATVIARVYRTDLKKE